MGPARGKGMDLVVEGAAAEDRPGEEEEAAWQTDTGPASKSELQDEFDDMPWVRRSSKVGRVGLA